MPDEDALTGELRAMREELAALKTAISITNTPMLRRYGWLKLIARDLETNPDTQYTVHKWGVYYWLINFPLITLLFFFEPVVWLKWGIFITLQYSIYANFSTDYAGLSAAMAAKGVQPLPPIPLEPPNGNGIIVSKQALHRIVLLLPGARMTEVATKACIRVLRRVSGMLQRW